MLKIPKEIEVRRAPTLIFAAKTGNESSLNAYQFYWKEEKQLISYQFQMGSGHYLKKSNKSGFVLLETLMALTVTVACIYLVSSSNRFLLQLDKQNNRRVLLVRRLYEDVKTFRKHQQLPSRTIVEPKSKTVIESNQNGIQQVKITQEEDTIEILQK